MTEVSIINELAQRNAWGFPKYTTVRVGGEDHRPTFRTTLWVGGNGVTNDHTGSASDAKRLAAREWLACHAPEHLPEQLMTPDQFSSLFAAPAYTVAPCPSTLPLPESVVEAELASLHLTVHLDAENRSEDLNIANEAAAHGTRVVAYAAAKWPALNKNKSRYPKLEWRVADSAARDAADVLLLINVVQAIGWQGSGDHKVVGGDSFFFALRDILSQLKMDARFTHAATWADLE